eukprot:TRINITY_DN1165_c0_g1_i1.p2 TRINITY_DN1165_c0_g1~~TRINITY_DN1165_c0_g1_i1.p2  ORF type:complete len:169 (-),score=53.03 TRINITY_DN1165_c0_g1_i1:172-678(-)
MSNPKCAVCNKTAYPLESVNALEKAYHKACFKCAVCGATLNLKNFKGYEGVIYCLTHTPKPTHTQVTDSIAVKQALSAPKKTAEGLGNVQKGSGGSHYAPGVPVEFKAEGGEGTAPEHQGEYEEQQQHQQHYEEQPQETYAEEVQETHEHHEQHEHTEEEAPVEEEQQ